MKLYEHAPFPNPRRVRIFLAEKGVEADRVDVDVAARAHKAPAFLSKNPYGVVPMLELDDGTAVAETIAICRYIEEAHPTPSLMGETPTEKAVIDMWQKRAEDTALGPALTYFHHATDGLGEPDRYRNREWGEKNRDVALEGFEKIDAALADRAFVAGPRYTVADITTLAAVDLAEALGFDVLTKNDNLRRWHQSVANRPSAASRHNSSKGDPPMRVNADFDQSVLLKPEDREWIRSPAAGVERQMLDRIGDEVARATSIVRYIPGSTFDAHEHELGEEFLVLEGVFADEHGAYPAGTYVRNPPGTAHRPDVPDGCVILVKLRQFDPEDLTPVVADLNDAGRYSETSDGARTARLHAFDTEVVRAIRLDPGAHLSEVDHGGAELFVLSGAVRANDEILSTESWLRVPPARNLEIVAGETGAHLWIKTGHLSAT